MCCLPHGAGQGRAGQAELMSLASQEKSLHPKEKENVKHLKADSSLNISSEVNLKECHRDSLDPAEDVLSRRPAPNY